MSAKTISEEWASKMDIILKEAEQKKLDRFFVLEVLKETAGKKNLYMQKLLAFSDKEKKTLGFDTRVIEFYKQDKTWLNRMVYYCGSEKLCATLLNKSLEEMLANRKASQQEILTLQECKNNAERLLDGK